MAATFVISCPECQKKFKGREELQGKKIRCPNCGHSFIVQAMAQDKVDSAAEKVAPEKAKARAPAAPAKMAPPAKVAAPAPVAPPPAPPDDDNDLESNPYGVTTVDMSPRCPSCTEELPSEDTLVCPSCGYNTQTRTFGKTIRTIEHTGGERFMWLLPGLLCFVGIIILYLLAVFYCTELPGLIDHNSWVALFDSEAMRLWITWMLLGGIWGLAQFSHKRLIFNPKPAEKIKS